MAIAACFVFQREISRSVFWDFFDSIGRTEKNSARADVFRFALELRHCSIQCEEEVRSRTKTPFAPWLSVVAFGLPRENASNRSAVQRRECPSPASDGVVRAANTLLEIRNTP